MTNKSDRQDGDGLPLENLVRLAHQISRGTLFLRLPDPTRPSTELKEVEKQTIVMALHAYARSPTRDGAVGACIGELKILVDEYDPQNSDWEFRKEAIRDVLFKLQTLCCSAAPPKPAPQIAFPQDEESLAVHLAEIAAKPAPDAVLADIIKTADWHSEMDAKAGLASHLARHWPAIRAVIGAPVPSPGGALEQLARHFEAGKFGKDKYLFPDEIASVIREFSRSPAVAAEPDPLADLVSRFSTALLAKLHYTRDVKGRSGWDSPYWARDCQRALIAHIAKGDPLDVAAYTAFCWHHGWTTAVLEKCPLCDGEGVLPPDGGGCEKCGGSGRLASPTVSGDREAIEPILNFARAIPANVDDATGIAYAPFAKAMGVAASLTAGQFRRLLSLPVQPATRLDSAPEERDTEPKIG